jgi:hypothetical protein
LPLWTDGDREEQQRNHQNEEVQDGLSSHAEPTNGGMRVGITGEQGDLEEDHARIPDRRRATEPRQDHLREHRLHDENQ